MAWEFEQAGKFGSEKAADDYARRNNLDPRDVQITRKGGEVELSIRRSALDGRSSSSSSSRPTFALSWDSSTMQRGRRMTTNAAVGPEMYAQLLPATG